MIVSFILRCMSIYGRVNQKVRLFMLFILCPFPFSLVCLLLLVSKSASHGHPTPSFLLLMLVPEFFFTFLGVAVFVLFIYEWYVLVARRVRNVMLFNAAVLLGTLWPVFSMFHFSKVMAAFVFLLFGRSL